jgi:hypothetical protein
MPKFRHHHPIAFLLNQGNYKLRCAEHATCICTFVTICLSVSITPRTVVFKLFKSVKFLQLNLNIHRNPVKSLLFGCKNRTKLS